MDACADEYRYRVLTTGSVTPVIRKVLLGPAGATLPYRPGQYVLLSDEDHLVPQRSFSVANAPRPDGRISLLITRVEGGATSMWAHRLRVGDTVLVEGPYGAFTAGSVGTSPVLLLAAGSGLAPVRSLAEALLDGGQNRPVTLFFSGRTAADAIDRAQFQRWQRERSSFRYLLTLTRSPAAPRHSRIPGLLATEFATLRNWHVFAAGPHDFVVDCAAAARTIDAASTDVHTEEFFIDPQPWTGVMPSLPTPAEALR